jgi:flagellar hook-associated protein 1 FlgK
MSFFAFNIAGNALDAYQQAENVTSNNIANVSTPGASRQSAEIVEAQPIAASPFGQLPTANTLGEGSMVTQITRIHQDSYDGLFRGASSSQYYYTMESQQLTSLQSNFGEPDSGVSSAFSALQAAISGVAQSPTETEARVTVLSAAQTFAQKLNASSQAISNQEAAAVSEGADLVTTANTYITQIASLNGQIRSLTATGGNPNTYLDQRDYAIDQLSQIVPTSTSLQPNGSALVTVGGLPVVSDTVAYDLAPPVVGTASNGASTLVVGFADDPDPSNPAPIPLGSGQLGAITDLYNNRLGQYGQQLDNFASATASEINRITQAGVDYNGNAGLALFTNAAGSTSITAASISVNIADPNQLPLALTSTAASNLTVNMGSGTNTVETTSDIDGYASLNNPPSGPLTGTLTIAVDGANQTFSYNTASGGNADTVGDFMSNFNAGHYGVTATFDPISQTIVFARDPANTDPVSRGKQGSNATTPDFTITDSNASSGTAPGTAATSLLQALGAAAISGVAQTPTNAFGNADNGAATALVALFTTNVGVGAVQTTANTVSPASPSSYPASITITPPAATPGPFSNVDVGAVLTVVNATTGTTQNVDVTAVDRTTGSVTVNASAAINAGDPVSTAATQTLGSAYAALVTSMATDTSNATTGQTTQTSLASSINDARQSVDGINIDEETQNLLEFQNAYAAAAKTISTLNTMLQTAINLIQ